MTEEMFMGSKKEFLYSVKVERKDGRTWRFGIFKKGRTKIIYHPGGEYLVHPAATSIESEIALVFDARVIRKIMPFERE